LILINVVARDGLEARETRGKPAIFGIIVSPPGETVERRAKTRYDYLLISSSCGDADFSPFPATRFNADALARAVYVPDPGEPRRDDELRLRCVTRVNDRQTDGAGRPLSPPSPLPPSPCVN